MKGVFLEIHTDEGVNGVAGPLHWLMPYIYIDTQLKRLLIVRDPFATELIRDQMYGSSPHGRKGFNMRAISYIDIALWDIRGKAYCPCTFTMTSRQPRARPKMLLMQCLLTRNTLLLTTAGARREPTGLLELPQHPLSLCPAPDAQSIPDLLQQDSGLRRLRQPSLGQASFQRQPGPAPLVTGQVTPGKVHIQVTTGRLAA